MTQGTIELGHQPEWIYGRTWDNPVDVASGLDPWDNSGSPNIMAVFNYKNDTFYISDRAGHAGAYVPARNDHSGNYTVIENPGARNNAADSSGFIMRAGVGDTYNGDAIYARMDFVEESEGDPVAAKSPRRTFISAARQEKGKLEDTTEPSAHPTIAVSGDFGDKWLVDSSTLSFVPKFAEQTVWWRSAIEGERLYYALEYEESSPLIIEGIASESRQRSRRSY